MKTRMLPLALVAGLLAASGAASALYIVTPLRMSASDPHGEVGDAIELTIAPENETTAAEWSGKSVRLAMSYDPNERPEGEEPAEPSEGEWTREDVATLTLAADTTASHTWTIPASVDDKNVVLLLEADDGTLLAQADVAVGDAPPIMKIAAGSPASGEPIPQENELPEEVEEEVPAERGAPGIGALALVAAVGALALGLRRRGRA